METPHDEAYCVRLRSGCSWEQTPGALRELQKQARSVSGDEISLTGFPSDGWTVTDGLSEYGWYVSAQEAQRCADLKNAEKAESDSNEGQQK